MCGKGEENFTGGEGDERESVAGIWQYSEELRKNENWEREGKEKRERRKCETDKGDSRMPKGRSARYL